MSDIWHFIVTYQLALGWIIAVMIDQLPPPINGNAFYKWFFGVVQVLAANVKRAKLGIQGQLHVEK